MPRLSYVTNEDFVSGKDTRSPENENIDLCRRCWPKRMGWIPPQRIADGFWSEGDDHPEYEGTDYDCMDCGRPLTRRDD